jgi:hypothetical protein
MKRVLLVAAIACVVMAHVGSPNALFDGNAGPYPVRVVVRPPDVVPGLADVSVLVTASDVQHVLIRPVFWRAGVAGAPAGDEARLVPGQNGIYAGKLWLMSRGAYSVYVTVTGARGSGTAIVPVSALATARLGISRGLSAILVVLAALLVAGFVTIVRAAAGEALLPPGESLDDRTRRRARIVSTVAAGILGVLVLGGARWWSSVDHDYQRTMYRPPAVDADVRSGALTLRIHDTAAFHVIFAPVIPDHGKMMHLFLIAPGTHAAFGHFHPIQADSLVFRTTLAGWPAGKYRLFGDIVLANGLSQTVTTTIDWPGDSTTGAKFDGDDSWWPTCCNGVASRTTPALLGAGYKMSWAGGNEPLVAGKATDLRFEVRDENGQIAELLPYLGMVSHAVILSADESVFVHLHPMGTVSASAQQAFAARDRGDTTDSGRPRLAADSVMPMQMDGHLAFPYEFPKAGRYRIWVQVKPPNSQVLTGAFDVDVH